LPSADDLVPSRTWNVLIALSTARGRVLRRRRRALQAAAPVSAAAVLVLTGVLLTGQAAGHDSLTEVPADRHHLTTPEPTPPHPRPNTARTVTGGEWAPPPAAPRSQPARPAPAGHALPPTALPTSSVAVHHSSVAFDDARGDGVLTGSDVQGVPNPAGPAASDDAMDVLAMRFESDQHGVTITMTLAGAHRTDASYTGTLTDSRTGCQLKVYLGGADPDGYYDSCSTTGDYTFLPTVVDPSTSVLRAVVPWSWFPADVSPHRALGLEGTTYATSPAGGYQPWDRATTSRKLEP
jgi:hypothetical protein